MSAIIDDKIVAGAQDPNVVKEDPIVILTVCFSIIQIKLLLRYSNILVYIFLGKSKIPISFSGPLL